MDERGGHKGGCGGSFGFGSEWIIWIIIIIVILFCFCGGGFFGGCRED